MSSLHVRNPCGMEQVICQALDRYKRINSGLFLACGCKVIFCSTHQNHNNLLMSYMINTIAVLQQSHKFYYSYHLFFSQSPSIICTSFKVSNVFGANIIISVHRKQERYEMTTTVFQGGGTWCDGRKSYRVCRTLHLR